MKKTTHTTMLRVDRSDLQLAKTIAAARGISMKDWFTTKVKEDFPDLPNEIMRCGSFDERYPWRRRRG